MGIHQLLTFLRGFNQIDEDEPENNVYVVSMCDFDDLRGRTLAIDISTFLYAQYNGATQAVVKATDLMKDMIDEFDIEKMFFKNLITRMETFLRIGCSLVVVFDGKASELKDVVRLERRAKRIELSNKIGKAMEELNNTDPFDRTPAMINNLKALLKQQANIPDSCVQEVKEMFSLMGFTVVQAIGEAERTCSALCREGLVDAVVSTDSDCLAHGCPILISKILDKGKVEVIVLDEVLEALELEFDEFQELCIASGCDYNQINGKCIKNCRITKLYPMFKRHRTFENVVDKFGDKYDFDVVMMDECKEQFNLVPLSELMEDEYQPPINNIHSDLRTKFEEYGLEYHVGVLLDLYSKFVHEDQN